MTTAVIIYYVFSFLFMVGVNGRNKDFKLIMCIWLLFFAWIIFPMFIGDYFTSKRDYYDSFTKD